MENQLETELSVLRELSFAVVHERNIPSLLNKVISVLNKQMGMLRSTITLRNDEDYFEIVAVDGLKDDEAKRGKYKLGEGITGIVGKTGVSQIIPDISKDARFRNFTKARSKEKNLAFLCVPIFYREKVVGTLSADKIVTPDVDLSKDLRFLEIVGNLFAEAVNVAKQIEEEQDTLKAENERLRMELSSGKKASMLVGNCNSMQHIYELIKQVAPSDATVLIRGSSGTGKELVASEISKHSPRANKPFIAINCAALPENLVESELFGHEKGSFTGAVARRIGRVEEADGGTLFLDEIGDLTQQTQVKLLRFIQERTFSRVGSNKELKSNVRLLAATSRNLEQLMEEGLFREDLYYRLNVFPITLPDLSKRRCDILLLAEHFIDKMNLRYGKNVQRLSTPAINMLMSYHWPGNVRELENCIERAVLTSSDDCIHGYNLPPSLQTGANTGTELIPDEQASFETLVNTFERELIVEALKKHNGNMSAAGRSLELTPRVMHYKINKLNISLI